MDFLEEAEKIAGAVAAVEGIKKLDPNAGILTEAAAAITGFEGAGAIAEHFKKKREQKNRKNRKANSFGIFDGSRFDLSENP